MLLHVDLSVMDMVLFNIDMDKLMEVLELWGSLTLTEERPAMSMVVFILLRLSLIKNLYF